jgi:hypothetical protein
MTGTSQSAQRSVPGAPDTTKPASTDTLPARKPTHAVTGPPVSHGGKPVTTPSGPPPLHGTAAPAVKPKEQK